MHPELLDLPCSLDPEDLVIVEKSGCTVIQAQEVPVGILCKGPNPDLGQLQPDVRKDIWESSFQLEPGGWEVGAVEELD